MDLNEYLAKEGFALTGEFRGTHKGDFFLNGSIGTWLYETPSTGNYLILRKLEDDEEPNRENLFTDMYLDIAEAGYELTGEYRRARTGEAFWDGARVRSVGFLPPGTSVPDKTYFKYLILKKLKRFFEFDGQKFEVPEGFEFERVGLVTEGDVGKWAPGHLEVERRVGDYNFCPDQITKINWKTFYWVTSIFTKKETN